MAFLPADDDSTRPTRVVARPSGILSRALARIPRTTTRTIAAVATAAPISIYQGLAASMMRPHHQCRCLPSPLTTAKTTTTTAPPTPTVRFQPDDLDSARLAAGAGAGRLLRIRSLRGAVMRSAIAASLREAPKALEHLSASLSGKSIASGERDEGDDNGKENGGDGVKGSRSAESEESGGDDCDDNGEGLALPTLNVPPSPTASDSSSPSSLGEDQELPTDQPREDGVEKVGAALVKNAPQSAEEGAACTTATDGEAAQLSSLDTSELTARDERTNLGSTLASSSVDTDGDDDNDASGVDPVPSSELEPCDTGIGSLSLSRKSSLLSPCSTCSDDPSRDGGSSSPLFGVSLAETEDDGDGDGEVMTGAIGEASSSSIRLTMRDLRASLPGEDAVAGAPSSTSAGAQKREGTEASAERVADISCSPAGSATATLPPRMRPLPEAAPLRCDTVDDATSCTSGDGATSAGVGEALDPQQGGQQAREVAPVARPPLSPPSQRRQHSMRNIRDPNLRDETDDSAPDVTFHAEVTARYPPTDRPDNPLNAPMLPHFCRPGSEPLEPTESYSMPTIHYFVLTNAAGHKLYCTCLTVWEEYKPEEEDGDEDEDVDVEDARLRAGTRLHSSNVNGGDDDGGIELTWSTPKLGRKAGGTMSWKEDDLDDNRGGSSGKATQPAEKLTPVGPTLYLPKVLCLLSTWPYLTAFKEYLSQLYRLATLTDQMSAPLERYVLNICEEVPAPPPGAFEIRIDILDSAIRFWAPPANQPIPYVSLPFRVLFECLDLGNVLYAWYALALERKVLLVSSQYSLLTLCGEILLSLLFPMQWSHLYIPVLPRFLSPMLDAPMPYLCGIGRDHLPHSVGDIGDETIVVDLDRNFITQGPATPDLPPIPHRRRAKLEAALDDHAGEVFWNARGLSREKVRALQARGQSGASGAEEALDTALEEADRTWETKLKSYDEAFDLAYTPDAEDEALKGSQQSQWDAVQEAFLGYYVAVLKDYKRFLKRPDGSASDLLAADEKENALGGRAPSFRSTPSSRRPTFDEELFASSQRPDFQPFLNELILTQQFDDFITKRMRDPGASDVTFFDQSIAAKHNRSRFKMKKVDTPFLVSASAHKVLNTVHAVKPNADGIVRYDVDEEEGVHRHKFMYKSWPDTLDPNLYAAPRPVPEMINAEFDRQSALTARLSLNYGGSAAGLNDSLVAAEGEEQGLEDDFWEMHAGDCSDSTEVATFTVFFVAYADFVGRDLRLLEKRAEDDELNRRGSIDSGVVANASSVDDSNATGAEMNPSRSRSLGIIRKDTSPWTSLHDVSESFDSKKAAVVTSDSTDCENCFGDVCGEACGGGLVNCGGDAGAGGNTNYFGAGTVALPEFPEMPDYQETLDEIKALLPAYDCTFEDLMGWGCASGAEEDSASPPGAEASDVTAASSADDSNGSVVVIATKGISSSTARCVVSEGQGDKVPLAAAADAAVAQRQRSASASLNHFDRLVLHAARFEEARAVARAQLDLGCSVLSTETDLRHLLPDPDVYKGLMEACGRCGDAERATELMGRVRSDGLVADSEMYSCYVEAFSTQQGADGGVKALGVSPRVLSSAPMKASAQRWMERSASQRRTLMALTPLGSSSSQTRLSASVLELFKDNKGKSGKGSKQDLLPAACSSDESDSSDEDDDSLTGTSDGASSLSSSTTPQRSESLPPPLARAGSGSIVNGFLSSLTAGGTKHAGSFNAAMAAKSKTKNKKTSSHKKKTKTKKTKQRKKKKPPVTDDVKKQVVLGEKLLSYLYPSLSVDTSSDTCPQCSWLLSEDDIAAGWNPRAFQDYSTFCPQCRHRFVPRFSVMSTADTFVGSQGPSTPLYCEFLSPWVLRKELQNVLRGGRTDGIDDVLNPEWRSGTDINATLWWNMVVSFRRYRLPVTFLLQGSFQNQLISPSPEQAQL